MTSKLTLDAPEDVLGVLERDGYAVVRDVLSAEQVARVREVCDGQLLEDADAETEIEATALLQMPEFDFMFDERLLRALFVWLGGTLAYYPNYVARLNRYTGWHIDNGFSPRFLPEPSHLYDPGFRHYQCVVYLQDNVPGCGGGLDVRPGSHAWAADAGYPGDDELARRYPEVVSIDSKAGDLIVFDGRLMHRGTPSDRLQRLRKYGIFWSASRADMTQMDRYIEYFSARVDYLRTQNLSPEELQREVERHRLMHSVRFPRSYLPKAAENLTKLGVAMAEMPSTYEGESRSPRPTQTSA